MRWLFLLFAVWLCGPSAARAYEHPSVPFTAGDLAAIKAKVLAGEQPWKGGYDALAGDGHASLSYTMQGPFDHVARNEGGTGTHINLTQWQNDMQATYYLALRWWFTGNAAYAQKSRDIMMAWAGTLTSLSGYEIVFEIGGAAQRYVTAADILRGTWPGWTEADTTTMKDHFLAVYWPPLAITAPLMSANQGGFQTQGAVAIAAFCDDATRMNQALASLTTDSDSGFRDTLANGEVGDTQRDQGHSYNMVWQKAWAAEVLWKQGIDVFSLMDNRILATSEYYCRYNLPGSAPPFIQLTAPFTSSMYTSIGGAPRSSTQNRLVFNLVHSAYVVRKGIPAPWTTLYRNDMAESAESFMYRKPADSSTATPYAPPALPATASLTTGLTSSNLNGATPGGSTSYSNGTWTMTGGYNGGDPWYASTSSDTVRFAHKQVTGDFTMVAKVASVSGHPSAKAGLMMRNALGSCSYRAWVAITPGQNYERAVKGYSNIPYGSNNAQMYVPIPQAVYWVKMERVGNRVQLFTSPNGGDWSPACVADFSGMPSTMYVGLFDMSYQTGTLNTTTFTDVRLTGGDGGEAAKIPPAPFSVLAAGADGKVQLRWNESFGATGYNVKRSTTSGSGYGTIATVPGATTFTDTTAANGTTYFYVVSATNSAGESANTAQDSATPQPEMVNLARGGSTSASSNSGSGSEGSDRAFDFNPGSKWFNGNSGTTGWLQYDFGAGNSRIVTGCAVTSAGDAPGRDPKDWQFQGSNGGGIWTTLDTQSGQGFSYRCQTKSYGFSNTTAYRYYRLNVTANNGDATGVQLSELALLGRADALPAAPAGLSATTISISQINLSWTASAGATSYEVLRGPAATGPFAHIATTAGTAFSNTSLGAATTHHYAVRAIGPGGISADSAPASATTTAILGKAISVDFRGGSATNGTPSAMDALEGAGVVSLANWNNASGASGAASALYDHTGAATTAAVAWTCNNSWSTPITESAGNARMMKGYLDTSETSVTTVTVANLPADLTASGYRVFVFCDGDNGTTAKTGRYTIDASNITATDAASANFSGAFTQAANSAGNYVLFTGVTGASFTLSAQATSSRAPINGIQIISNATFYTAIENWRFTHFGTAANTGIATDTFDANGDGELNLIEFATEQNPHAATLAVPVLVKNGATLEFTYTRANAALADGVNFIVEWRDSLTTGAWSSAGVTEQILTNNDTVQTVRATLAAGPGPGFVRLRVVR